MKPVLKFAWIKAFRRKRGSSAEKVSAIRIGAISFTAALVMMFGAINTESTEGTARYYRTNTNELVVTQTGSHSNAESSIVPVSVMRSLEQIDEIEVAGITNYFGKLEGRDVLYAMYEAGQTIEPLLSEGRHISDDDETVIDRDLASSLGISLGDTVRLVDTDFEVVGLSRETGSFGKEMVFVSNQAMFDFYGGVELYNQIAIDSNDSVILQHEIASFGGSVELITQQQYIDGIVSYWERNVSPLIFTIIAIVTLFSVVSLLVFLTNQLKLQLPTLAIFRACGASKRQMAQIEAVTMSMLAIAGFLIGIPLAWVLIEANNIMTPGFHASLDMETVALAAAVVFLISVVAVAVTSRKATRITPIELMNSY
jgi:putative ABC transport system permease protein